MLPHADPAALGLAASRLARLDELVDAHVREGRYEGAQVVVARAGRIAWSRAYGNARVEPTPVAATPESLFLLFSQTKALTSTALWTLVDDGLVSFLDRVVDHVPGFEVHGKGAITLEQVLTHRGGFPSANVSQAAWSDHGRMREEVCAFPLEWEPGSRVVYHADAAHLVVAMVLEAATGLDYREVVRRRVLAPLGLEREILLGVPAGEQHRCADTFGRDGTENTAAFREAGLPSRGAYGTARAMATLYQCLGSAGRLGAVQLVSPRILAYATRNHTGEEPDAAMDGIPMHRGLGPHVRGTTDRTRGLGTIAAPATFGHGGVGSSYSWVDPTSRVSFTYLTNRVSPEPWHSQRMDRVSNLVHASIVEGEGLA